MQRSVRLLHFLSGFTLVYSADESFSPFASRLRCVWQVVHDRNALVNQARETGNVHNVALDWIVVVSIQFPVVEVVMTPRTEVIVLAKTVDLHEQVL
jgi:hypothetical protein